MKKAARILSLLLVLVMAFPAIPAAAQSDAVWQEFWLTLEEYRTGVACIEDIQASIIAAQAQTETLKSRIAQLESAVAENEKKSTALEAAYAEASKGILGGAMSWLLGHDRDYEAERAAWEAERASLHDELAKASAALRATEETVDMLKTELAVMKDILEMLRALAAELNIDLNEYLQSEQPAATQQPVPAFSVPVVEQALRQQLGKSAGVLTAEEMASVTFIELSQIDAAIVLELQKLTGLQALFLELDGQTLALAETTHAFTMLSTLPGLTKLYLFIDVGQYEQINLTALSVLTGVKELSLLVRTRDETNPMAYLDLTPLSALVGLEDLCIIGNINNTAPLAALTSLRKLELDGIFYDFGYTAGYPYVENKLDFSPFAALKQLEELFVYHGDVVNLSALSGLTHMTRLSLEMCDTDWTALAALRQLTSLNISHNRIADLSPLSGLTELSNLYFDDCNVADLSPLAGLTKLCSLSFVECPVIDISLLLLLPSLQYVSLPSLPDQNRAIVDALIAKGCEVYDDGFFDDDEYDFAWYEEDEPQQQERSVIVFTNAAIERAVWAALGRTSGPVYADEIILIIVLDLRGLELTDISDLTWLTGLEKLYLQDNLIVDISPLAKLPRLSELYLANNHITDVSVFYTLPSLRTLDLSGNIIVDTLPLYLLVERGCTILLDGNPTPTITAPATMQIAVLVIFVDVYGNVIDTMTLPWTGQYDDIADVIAALPDEYLLRGSLTPETIVRDNASLSVLRLQCLPYSDTLPEMTYTRAVLNKGNFPLYSAPSKSAARMAKSKASVSTNEAVYLYGTINSWTLLHYEVTSGADDGHYRLGYVASKLTSNKLTLASLSATMTGACTLTDDPVYFNNVIRAMAAGERVTALARMGRYVYIETTLDGKQTRGFVPGACILLD